ncbi:MAG TPA: carboxymuconolactone decarboxylase family protein [Streptosporangiaceae bacterium]|nr:carboxymuconolactone decarboxylase family protein [Streptosporangiaceae bacterium]
MARISLDPPRTLSYRLSDWYSRRHYGQMLAPGQASGHNPRVLRTVARAELSLARWRTVPDELKELAVMAAAARLNCSWCMDFGFWVSFTRGLDPAKLRAVPHWRDSDLFTETERAVLEYAEAMCETPLAVTDEMVAGLRRDLDEAQLVELTMMIAVENQRSRFNSALGLTSQGFSDRCSVPA